MANEFRIKNGLIVSGNATVSGIVLDGNTITGIDDSGEFTDDDAHIMTSAGINDKFGLIAGSSSIVTVGTITTGTWNGTAIASAYLDTDTAHLSGTQTFSGNKTFSGSITLGGHAVNDIDVAGEFVDSDEHLMTSAAINDRIAAAGGGASALNDLSDVIASGSGNLWISPGDTPSHGTLSSAIQNISIGKLAGDAITEGDRNISIGTAAGSGITTGEGNITIGDFAQYTQTTGSANVVVGRQALFGNGVKSNNTGFGHNALYAATTGSNNLALGFEAGNNITSGSHNVVIGNADVASATGDSQLSISSGDGGVTWITGNSSGGINSKAEVVAVSSNTVLTLAKTGSYVYWTGGSCTLPTSATVGTQFTVFNNTGGSATVALGTNNAIVSGWAGNAAVADHEATSYICVAATKWIQVG